MKILPWMKTVFIAVYSPSICWIFKKHLCRASCRMKILSCHWNLDFSSIRLHSIEYVKSISAEQICHIQILYFDWKDSSSIRLHSIEYAKNISAEEACVLAVYKFLWLKFVFSEYSPSICWLCKKHFCIARSPYKNTIDWNLGLLSIRPHSTEYGKKHSCASSLW